MTFYIPINDWLFHSTSGHAGGQANIWPILFFFGVVPLSLVVFTLIGTAVGNVIRYVQGRSTRLQENNEKRKPKLRYIKTYYLDDQGTAHEEFLEYDIARD